MTSDQRQQSGRGRSAVRSFLAAAIRSPATVGAVVPSSRRLATLLASAIPHHGTPTVVELGAGTGAVSRVICEQLPTGSRHIALDVNPAMVSYLRDAHPEMDVVHADARDLTQVLLDRGVAKVDTVVSGLPWSLIPESAQSDILDDVASALGRTGTFTTFAYLHGLPLRTARAFRKRLETTFDHVSVTRPVWRNVPPAVAYVCRGAS